jgi:hypothetical protein
VDLAQQSEQGFESRTQASATQRTDPSRVFSDPAVELELHRLAEPEVAESDAWTRPMTVASSRITQAPRRA